MYFAGIDIGSVSTDVVIIDQEGNIRGAAVIDTGPSYKRASEQGIAAAAAAAGVSRSDLNGIVSTGYGRKSTDFGSKPVTEIKCHAIGAFHLSPEVRTIIDIGGQDCKVIALNDKGGVRDFVMNDKCSAGTGRFVDVMARALAVDLADVGPLSLQSKKISRISSICTVFAESEVITKLSEEVLREDIIRGIHVSIGERILNLAQRVGVKERVAITGGGGKNIGIVRVLEELLNTSLITYPNPQIIGALGAALEARDSCEDGQQARADAPEASKPAVSGYRVAR